MPVPGRPRRPLLRGVLLVLLGGLLCIPLPPSLHGQEPSAAAWLDTDPEGPALVVPRLSGPVTLDGRPDETAWEQVPTLPMSMWSPTFRGEMTERTEVRIAHDDEHLYVSGRMFDSRPGEIRTNTFYRDLYSGDDLLAVVIDSYDDRETAVWFVTNPAGARNDRTVANDAVFAGGGPPMNTDWNAHWSVETAEDEEGWYAEFRIPFSTLGFQATDGEVTMGLIAYRFIPRKNERQLFPAIDPRWGGLAFAKPSRARRVVLRDVASAQPVYVTPYTLGGVRQTPRLEDPGSGSGSGSGDAAWRTESDPTTEAGLDVRFSPISNVALDFTVNTDFAQVEADDQQINLTRFPLFFPEKRQFFQERSSTFDFSTGGFNNRLFHSRRIGLEEGDIVRIYGGGRAVGRLGGMDFGLLSLQTAGHDGSPAENMSVARVNQQVLNPYSSVGAMVTSRLGARANIAYGLDAVYRPFGDEYATLKWAQTSDEGLEEASALSSGLLLARWERRTDEGFAYSGEYVRVGDDYLPRLGFQTRRDFRFFGGSTQYKSFRGAESPLRSLAGRLQTGHYLRLADGSAESRSVEPEVQLEFKGGTEVTVGATSSFESVLEPFSVSEATVPAGEYWFHEARTRLMLPRSGLFRGQLEATAGSFYDGTRWSLALEPTWNQSKYLELAAGYEVNRLDFSDRGETTTAHLGRLKVQVALSTRIQLSAFTQYSDVADLTTFNGRFRYHFREGTDLWVVYNEGVNTVRGIADRPRLPLSAGRTLMVKYTHTLIW